MVLRLPRDLLDAVVAHCRAEHPIEACGVLAGRDGQPERHIPMRNAAQSRTRYAMDPDEQLAVWRDMDGRGEQPVVIYHSHTATEAVPSAPDVRFAAEPDAHYLIVSTRGEMPEARSYRVSGGVAIEEPIEVVTEPSESSPLCRCSPPGDARWAVHKTPDGAHVVPLNDLVDHDLDQDCPCGPAVEHLTRDGGGDAWLTSHESLDRREEQETTQ